MRPGGFGEVRDATGEDGHAAPPADEGDNPFNGPGSETTDQDISF
jgi:hypothetical protein